MTYQRAIVIARSDDGRKVIGASHAVETIHIISKGLHNKADSVDDVRLTMVLAGAEDLRTVAEGRVRQYTCLKS